MNLWIIILLLSAAGLMMILEMRGLPVVLSLPFKGDIKRESQWLAQFGQAVATAAAMGIIYSFEPGQPLKPVAVMCTVFGTSLGIYCIKRLTGRVRPNRENAGRFLGPTWQHANWRESFPSSHSGCAIALTVSLVQLYPQGLIVFWALGLTTAVLRYLMDAHWPSDVLAGITAGYVMGHLIMPLFGFGN